MAGKGGGRGRGQRNVFGRFDLDVAPAVLTALRRRFPLIVHWEQRIWDQSLAQSEWRRRSEFPYFERKTRGPREFGFVAYLSDDDRSLSIQPLYPKLDLRRARLAMIDLPAEVKRTGIFRRTGYRPVLIEHTHPVEYGFQNGIGESYIQGPSGKDFLLQFRNKTAIGVVQALAPTGERQFFYYGPLVSR